MSVVRPLRACLIGAVGTLLLTVNGCSSGDVPTAKPIDNPVSSSPVVSDPRITPATAAGIESFVRAYYAEISRAATSGDTTQLVMFSRPTCGCRKLVRHIAEVYGKNLRIASLDYQLRRIRTDDPGGHGVADVYYTLPPEKIVDSSGRVVQQSEPVQLSQVEITLVRSSDRWVINDVIAFGEVPA